MSFPAPYDRTTRIVSAISCAVLLGGGIAIQNAFVAGTAVLVILLAFVYSPRSYSIAGRSVLIERWIGDARVPLDDVREARRATKDDLRGLIRLWGSGGLFGYYGAFRSRRLGRSTWYVTDRSRAVVVISGSKTVLFSPGDVDAFLAAIRALQ